MHGIFKSSRIGFALLKKPLAPSSKVIKAAGVLNSFDIKSKGEIMLKLFFKKLS